ncbi:hypothetical protein QRD89_06580 [Halobacillus sp. ACCC02827]|uniref:hypothetical protein n=1 Tax=Halobacillus sp. ACCC02827 TaxID=3052090 RepID=UPI00256FD596|nr:hypothetical protein [Halobacillus sp. ACCC02827]WJE17008.1 hypothetical protein QRD89_06580 [Halobacillus sp. ACCC02827]
MTTLKKFSYAALIAASVLNMLIAGATLAGLFLVDTRNGLNGTEYWLVGNQAFLVATLLVFIGTLVLFYLLAKGRPEKRIAPWFIAAGLLLIITSLGSSWVTSALFFFGGWTIGSSGE